MLANSWFFNLSCPKSPLFPSMDRVVDVQVPLYTGEILFDDNSLSSSSEINPLTTKVQLAP